MENITDVKIGRSFDSEFWKQLAERMDLYFAIFEKALSEVSFAGKLDVEDFKADAQLTMACIMNAVANPESIRFLVVPDKEK